MTFAIRPYLSGDRDALEALAEDYAQYFVDIDPLKRSRKMPGYARVLVEKMIEAAEAKSGVIFVAEDSRKVVGFIAGVLEQSTPEQELDSVPFKSGRVIELFVPAESRRRGLGTALMQKIEAYFADLGCDSMRLEVFEPNHLAHDFYLKLGYHDRVIDMLKELSR
jgi:ribosomal protein S18 acetylase RimI-like enzyme